MVSKKKPAPKKSQVSKTEKKPAPRAAAVRTRRRPALVDAPPERCFWVNFGPVLKNLRDLRDALAAAISEEQYAHHVAADRSDFANWVEAVLLDPQCAKALRKAKTPRAALKAVEASLAKYAG